MKLVQILLFYNFAFLSECVFYKSNTTDLTKCGTVSYTKGGTYDQFYPISLKSNVTEGSLLLDFHFAVLASSDAHVLLAPSDNVTNLDPVYEVVIGAGGNTFSDIRRQQKSRVKASVRIKGLLSAVDVHLFWLHFTKVGTGSLLEVGREGDNTSFISWLDPDPLPIKAISFSTWSGIEAKWYFHCDRSGNEEEIQKRLTTLEKLRRNMLNQYDPMVRPVLDQNTFSDVYVSMKLNYLELDERKSIMDLAGKVKLQWQDENLKWDPKNYGNIQKLHIFRREIWRPELSCPSSASNPYGILDDSMMVVNHSGRVTWEPAFRVSTFCGGIELNNWPRDTHSCNVSFSFVKDWLYIKAKIDDVDVTQLSSLQWNVVYLSANSVAVDKNEDYGVHFNMAFKIKRVSSVYNTVFFTPILVIGTFLLLTFWVNPKSHMKISLGCVQLLIETLMLLTLGSYVPNGLDGVPFLTLLYSWSLVATLISIIVSIMVINCSRNKHIYPLSHILSNILGTTFVKSVLLLPEVEKPDEYGQFGTQKSLKIEDKEQSSWILLGVALDRISFTIYFVLIGYTVGNYVCF